MATIAVGGSNKLRRFAKSFAIVTGFSSCLLARNVYSQTFNLKSEFSKDFANGVVAGVEVPVAKGERVVRPDPRPERPGLVQGDRLPGRNLNQDVHSGMANAYLARNAHDRTERPSIRQQESRLNLPEGAERVISLDLIVNSLDVAHFNAAESELRRFVKTSKARVGIVRHIGNYKNVSMSFSKWVESVGGSVTSDFEPPKDLHVTLSPTWVVRTSKQTYVFEGVADPTQFLSEYGEFVSPDNKSVARALQPTPVPTEVNDEF